MAELHPNSRCQRTKGCAGYTKHGGPCWGLCMQCNMARATERHEPCGWLCRSCLPAVTKAMTEDT